MYTQKCPFCKKSYEGEGYCFKGEVGCKPCADRYMKEEVLLMH